LLQVAIVIAIALLRYRRRYRDIETRIAGFGADTGDAGAVAAAASDRTVSWQGYRGFLVIRKVFEDRAHTVCSLHLLPADGGPLPDFMPGQFLTFRLVVNDSTTGGQKEIVRCYSLSDRPGLDHYRISVKRIPPPADSPELPPGLSSGYLHDGVQDGDTLFVRAPAGHFFLESDEVPVVLIAGGIGITPMLSMLNATLMSGSQREIWLFYGVRDGAEQVMKEHLESLAARHANFQLHVCYSRPTPGDVKGRDYQHEGHVDIDLLRLTLHLKPYQFYICGPRAMMESLVPALDAWGVPDRNIHYEAFGPASLSPSLRRRTIGAAAPPPVAGTLTVTFSRSGKAFTWDGQAESLLDFAEKNGIAINSGCRAGSCGSCETVIEAGEVDYAQEPDFDPEPGRCLLCISRPVRDLTLSA